MMYVIYNNDGSIKLTNLNEIITQNSNNVSKIFFAVEGYDTDSYNADATFELSNGDANTLVATISSMTLDTTPYVGWEFSLTNAQTASPGRLLASIELKNLSDVVLFTFPLDLFVNKTTLQPNETTITIAQYNNLRDAMLGKQDKFGLNTLRIYQTMGDANADLSNLVLGQLVYVIAENKLFQVEGSPKALVIVNDNYVKQYPYNSSTTLQTIYDEVGLNKLFYAFIDNAYTLLMLQESVGGYSLLFWDELGYGETDTTQNLSETINNFTFHYTGSYFPYVENNSLGGSLTDEELAILSQPNSVFVCVGIIMHKVSSTRFERISVSATGANMSIVTQYVTINTSAKTFAFNNSYIPAYNASGIDNLLAQKQNLLINQFNIKSINGQSILGSGNLDVGGGSVAEWGNIGGNIQDQTDLQNALQDIRETAEGKSKTLAFRAEETAITSSNFNVYDYKKADGTSFEDFADFLNYVNAEYEENLHLINTDFLSQNGSIELSTSLGAYLLYYIGDDQWIVYTTQYITENYKTGDIFLIDELNYPDRWFKVIASGGYYFNKLETSKVDLTNYATKTELAYQISQVMANFAGLYDSTLVYAKGQVVIHDNKLYSCTTAITTPEAWDSTHWTQTTIANEFVNLHGSQVIDGDKNFTGALQKNGVDVATINTFAFKKITYADYQALSDNDKNSLLAIGCQIIGTLSVNIGGGDIINPVLFPCRDYSAYKQGIFIAGSGTQQPCVGTWEKVGQVNTLTIKIWFRGADQNMIIQSLASLNGRNINYYLNNVYPYMINSGTELKYETVNVINISANTTFTLATAPNGTYPEYKANITNSGASAIVLTFTGITNILCNDDSITISTNTLTLPSGVSIEVSIVNNKMVAINFEAQ